MSGIADCVALDAVEASGYEFYVDKAHQERGPRLLPLCKIILGIIGLQMDMVRFGYAYYQHTYESLYKMPAYGHEVLLAKRTGSIGGEVSVDIKLSGGKEGTKVGFGGKLQGADNRGNYGEVSVTRDPDGEWEIGARGGHTPHERDHHNGKGKK